jgi:2'-5' RNA ligase
MSNGLHSGAALAQPTDRIFFALRPDAETADAIAALALQVRAALGLHGRPLKTAHFHITLHHLGDYAGLPNEVIDRARHCAEAIEQPLFELVFDELMSFTRKTRNKPLVLVGGDGVEPVKGFRRQLGAALKAAGFKVDANFTPHLTLLYDDQTVARQSIEGVAPLASPVRWTAAEFVLVDSLIGHTHHLELARWPLGRLH